MGDLVIAAYRPKPGKDAELLALTRQHVPVLRRLGLATDRPAHAMLSKDGTVIEVFEWCDGGIERAHSDPVVLAMWGQYAEVCEYVPLNQVGETADLFAQFRPIDLAG